MTVRPTSVRGRSSAAFRGRFGLPGLICLLGACAAPEAVEVPPLGEVEVVLAGFDSLRVQLRGGAGQVSSEGVLIARASLTEWRLVGDLDGDGRLDALVVASSTGGGSGSFLDLMHLVLVDAGGVSSDWGWVGVVPLGDRVRVRGLTEVDGRVEVQLTEHGPDDPLCCPTVDATRAFEVSGGVLRPVSP